MGSQTRQLNSCACNSRKQPGMANINWDYQHVSDEAMSLYEVTRIASVDREQIWKWISVVLQYSNAGEMKNEIAKM